MKYKVGDRVRAVNPPTAYAEHGLEVGALGTVAGFGDPYIRVRWDGDPLWTGGSVPSGHAWLMKPGEIELVPGGDGHEATPKYRRSIADEVLAYADSIDEFTTKDDIYAGLLDLASEIRKGEWG